MPPKLVVQCSTQTLSNGAQVQAHCPCLKTCSPNPQGQKCLSRLKAKPIVQVSMQVKVKTDCPNDMVTTKTHFPHQNSQSRTCLHTFFTVRHLSHVKCTNIAKTPLLPNMADSSGSHFHSHMKAVLLDGCVTSCNWQCFGCHLGSGSGIHPAGKPLWQHPMHPPRVTAASNWREMTEAGCCLEP